MIGREKLCNNDLLMFERSLTSSKCSKIRFKSPFSLLKELILKANPRRELTAAETKCLNKLEAIAARLKRVENVQNRQLQT